MVLSELPLHELDAGHRWTLDNVLRPMVERDLGLPAVASELGLERKLLQERLDDLRAALLR